MDKIIGKIGNRKIKRAGMLSAVCLIAFLGAVFLSSCTSKEQESDQKVLTIGLFGENPAFLKKAESFFKEHPEYELVYQVYDYQGNDEDPYQQLKIEISAGKGPDVINFASAYSESVAAGGLTEDLYPWMEADRSFSMEDYFENIFHAFAVDGKLSAVPAGFCIRTAVGPAEYYQEMEDWDFQALSELYAQYQKDHILYPGETRMDVFGFLYTGTVSEYMDWEKGTCSFDGDTFQKLLEFSEQFPEALVFPEDGSVRQLFVDGTALLFPCFVDSIWAIGLNREMYEGQELAYMGYPNVGNVAAAADAVLGINVNSGHKQEAWEFIRYFLSEEYQTDSCSNLPVHRKALAQRLADAGKVTYQEVNGEQAAIVHEKYFEGEEPVRVEVLTGEDGEVLLSLISSIKASAEVDYSLYNIVCEEVQAYFAGDKSMEEIVKVLQGRMQVAMAERIR